MVIKRRLGTLIITILLTGFFSAVAYAEAAADGSGPAGAVYKGSSVSANGNVISANSSTVSTNNSISSNSVSADELSGYELYVNRGLNCVTVYENMEDGSRQAVKAFICSCGRPGGHNTPRGTFYVSERYRWRKMIDGTYAQYAIRFNDLILFHSVPYSEMKPDTLKWGQYNKLGTKASLGCVRLAVADVKWIYDNCPEGTKVVVYEDMDEELPIERPKSVHLTRDMENRGWDPTDPDKDNPWNE